MANTQNLVHAAEALGKGGGKLDVDVGGVLQPVDAATLKNMAIAAGLDQSMMDLLAMDIQNFADARKMAEEVGQLADYNLLGVSIAFDQGSSNVTPLMRTQCN